MTQATVLAWRGTGLVRLFDRQAHGDGGWGTRLARHGETIVESLRIIRHWQGLVLMQAGYRYLGIWLALGGLQLGQQAECLGGRVAHLHQQRGSTRGARN